ncbi:MAG: histidine kinase [Gemmatimonadaceae bacterium]|nr:histidine kinase [Gemmatimonadaceae bacterium]
MSYPQQLWRLMLILGGAMGFGISMVAYVARRFRPLQWRAFAIVTAGWCAVTLVIPGFDVRTWLTLVGSCAIAFVAVAPGAWRNAPEARPIAGVLLVLLVVAVVEQGLFLDRDVFLGVAVLAVLLLIDQVRQMRRLRDAEREARARSERLELELLRRRLAPHWLMNTLNAITSWIEEEPRTAVRMVEGLADEFRQLARMQDSAVVLVTEEVAACRRLLELMSLRTGTPFALTVQQLSPELRVPPGVLHTLVENALTHGSYRDGAMFTLAQRGGDASPVLEFVAPAPSARSTRTGDSGFGLHYVRTRLRERFGDAASVVDGPAEDGGWRTVLTLGGVSA